MKCLIFVLSIKNAKNYEILSEFNLVKRLLLFTTSFADDLVDHSHLCRRNLVLLIQIMWSSSMDH